ncbi:MAG: L,D-transpeptidase ErfK/SrfK [Thermoleophilaceae bacterium]|jgi:lipoprotein-anchoring transpeptidase ErfK/SrfK|nr:L,D-transpeptidase ErfK/SrfK [Thermoleophilaceae bacterium]
MRQRSFIVVAIAVAVLILGAVGVYAYDKTRDDVIAKGVTAGGVDLSGMHPSEARDVLHRQLEAAVRKPVYVKHGKHKFRLGARRAKVTVDVDGMVAEALAKSRDGNMLTRTTRAITGGSIHARIPLRLSYSKRAVERFAEGVGRSVDQDAQDASISFDGGQVVKVDSQDGRKVDTGQLASRIEADLVEPTADRKVQAPVETVKAKVTTKQLAVKYPRVIAINRGAFQLTLYDHLKVAKTYTIAVGQQGLETPAGRYNIQDKQIDPSWHVPNSAWAGSLAGKVIPPGPQDPIKARWMGIFNGAGIHGTDDIGSLGSAASHGCIRMAIPDVEELFDRVEVGDPVFIA